MLSSETLCGPFFSYSNRGYSHDSSSVHDRRHHRRVQTCISKIWNPEQRKPDTYFSPASLYAFNKRFLKGPSLAGDNLVVF
jgi:hypothetical protein